MRTVANASGGFSDPQPDPKLLVRFTALMMLWSDESLIDAVAHAHTDLREDDRILHLDGGGLDEVVVHTRAEKATAIYVATALLLDRMGNPATTVPQVETEADAIDRRAAEAEERF